MSFADRTCAQIKEIKQDRQQKKEAKEYMGKTCEPLYLNIYCNNDSEMKHPITGKTLTKHSIWSNALLFVLVVVILHVSSYLLCRLIHQLKTCGDNPLEHEKDD